MWMNTDKLCEFCTISPTIEGQLHFLGSTLFWLSWWFSSKRSWRKMFCATFGNQMWSSTYAWVQVKLKAFSEGMLRMLSSMFHSDQFTSAVRRRVLSLLILITQPASLVAVTVCDYILHSFKRIPVISPTCKLAHEQTRLQLVSSPT